MKIRALAGLSRGTLFRILLCLTLVALVGTAGSCASSTSRSGFYYTVKAGDNVYRIGKRFGVPPNVLVRVNSIDDVTSIRVGTRLWIPGRGAGNRRTIASASKPSKSRSEFQRRVRHDVRKSARLEFAWPIRGAKLTSRFGRRNGRPHEGIDLGAKKGTVIRAAEAGKVIHASSLGDYGRVVILKHSGNYRTVYAHSSRLLVRKGQFVEQGEKVALVGMTGRTSGPHLHFEIRRKDVAKDPMLFLP